MERVQFQQEQMLAELKDLVQKGLFTQQEVKQVMKRRTAFETALVRRIAKKNDYLRYAAYEMGLEALRKKRVERLKLPRTTPSVSDYALVRRQFHIFERALKKFKSDVALWIQYIQVAKKEGARSLVGRITARALQLHPNVPSLYILAAQHELAHLSPSSARALLQRGIRMNAESVEMWSEYIKMELGFVESMRRRWAVLGIDFKGKEKAVSDDQDGMAEGEVEKMQDEADGEGDDAEAARRQIMEGAIVKSVISNAVKALPKAELFVSLHQLISTYPAPEPLRDALLDHLHALLQYTLPTDPVAVRLTAARHLTSNLSGAALVDGLKTANETLSTAVEHSASQNSKIATGMADAYAEFLKEWLEKPSLDVALKVYLLTSLHRLVRRLSKSGVTPTPLLSAHLHHLTLLREVIPDLPYARIVPDLPARYTDLAGANADAKLWIARLNFEKSLVESGAGPNINETWKQARNAVRGEGALDVWTWGIPSEDRIESEQQAQAALQLVENLLAESMRMQDAPSFRVIHDHLLGLAASLLKAIASPTTRLASFRRLSASSLPSASAFEAFFASEASLSGPDSSEDSLREIFRMWRGVDVTNASLAWAGWLVRRGRGGEASEVVSGARAEVVGSDRQQEVEERWRRVLAEMDGARDGEDENEIEDEDEMMLDA